MGWGGSEPLFSLLLAHPVRPRVSLLKELCTSPDCCAGCYPTILRSWQVTLRELARNRSIRAYILKGENGFPTNKLIEDLRKENARTHGYFDVLFPDES